MPPATASFFKQSRNKMQAWVTNNPGLGHSQPGVATSAPATTYDPTASAQIQAPPESQSQPQSQVPSQTQILASTRHVTIPQPKHSTIQQVSPGRSRSPIVHANSQRAATATAVRIPTTSRSIHAHARDGPVNLARSKTISEQTKRPAPFWEGSTIEGSAFSDTASNNDSNASFAYRQMPVQGHPALSYQQHESTRHRPTVRQFDQLNQPPPFILNSDGIINVMGTENGNGLTRSASTPDAKRQRGGFKEVISDNGRDQLTDESSYNTSPEKTPSGKRLQHSKTIPLRPTRRGSYPERVGHSDGDTVTMPQLVKPHTFLNPNRKESDQVAQVAQAQLEPLPRLQVPDHQPHRSTIFADTDTPMASHPDESENASVEREPTPMPPAKTITKAKAQVNRQLFTRSSKGKASLRESAMPRSSMEKRQSATKKRSYELDYDDGALAAMDYETLKQEEFDFDPAQAEARSVFEPPRGTLPEKLDHFLGKDEANQVNFFTKMSVHDWEESGDWFLEQFGDIMARFKEARKEKRHIVDTFENEIAEREAAVRNRIHGIGQTLADLKTEGQSMMLGKELD
ncbi:hypothetical protein NPX13_g9197 [Xylaria arbuscula]|uniref:Extracellular mutant protein 11 C-terminal domain-containing protein n=1 Tax=Xylaria arbuscula TaxID=114810 RepID=A0A9W8TIP7_9PEZI|nr:hypothetical protein NPX13_g9197 [Xylaria arbuscula]